LGVLSTGYPQGYSSRTKASSTTLTPNVPQPLHWLNHS
jgi:hypothetical protein